MIAQGTGPNKKLAKRAAAENVLLLLGYTKPTPQPSKPALKSSQDTAVQPPTDAEVLQEATDTITKTTNAKAPRKVTFHEETKSASSPYSSGSFDGAGTDSEYVSTPSTGDSASTGPRQPAPGVILLAPSSTEGSSDTSTLGVSNRNSLSTSLPAKEPMNSNTSSVIKNSSQHEPPPASSASKAEPVKKIKSESKASVSSPAVAATDTVAPQPAPTEESRPSSSPVPAKTQGVRAKDELTYLATILGLKMQFSDFPQVKVSL